MRRDQFIQSHRGPPHALGHAGVSRLRIAEFRAEGSPVKTVHRRLPKRVGGPKHYRALNFPEVADALARIDAMNCLDEAGDPVSAC